MTTIQHGGPCGLRTRMRSAKRNENRGVFLEHCPIQAGTQLEGGVFQELLKRYFTTACSYLSHSAVVIPHESARPLPTREKGGDESDPPQNRGVMRTRVAARCSTLLSGPMGSLSSSFIPAGRLGTDPLSPRASSCRIGPRRQGFASPLRALDGSGPIRKTRCLRGERGGAGRGARSGGVARIVGESSGSLAHDKGYYHSLRRSRKGTFRPYQTPEPQPGGAVTRRAGNQLAAFALHGSILPCLC